MSGGTHDGLLAASRASLSLRLTCPVEDSLRCFSALCTFAVALWPPAAVCGKLLEPLRLAGANEDKAESWVTDAGAALAAAIDSESRLDTAVSSLCSHGCHLRAYGCAHG